MFVFGFQRNRSRARFRYDRSRRSVRFRRLRALGIVFRKDEARPVEMPVRPFLLLKARIERTHPRRTDHSRHRRRVRDDRHHQRYAVLRARSRAF